jgi:hypothetical protein
MPEYAPRTVRFPVSKPATIKLTQHQNPRRPIAGPERVAGEGPAAGAVMCRAIGAIAWGASAAKPGVGRHLDGRSPHRRGNLN